MTAIKQLAAVLVTIAACLTLTLPVGTILHWSGYPDAAAPFLAVFLAWFEFLTAL